MAKKNDTADIGLPFIGQEFSDKWGEWMQYRKERKLAAYTPTGIKMTFSRLKEISQGDYRIAMEVIDQSLANGWQGLFPLKINQNGTNSTNITGSNQSKPGTSEARIQTAKKW